MERPNIPPDSIERIFLSTANYVFTVVFAVEMFVKVIKRSSFMYIIRFSKILALILCTNKRKLRGFKLHFKNLYHNL